LCRIEAEYIQETRNFSNEQSGMVNPEYHVIRRLLIMMKQFMDYSKSERG